MLNLTKNGIPQEIWLSESLQPHMKTKYLLHCSWKYFILCYGFHSQKVVDNIVSHKHMEEFQIPEYILSKIMLALFICQVK